nr:hypothetical protein BaRGS_030790 [Batillaria attramentaria]
MVSGTRFSPSARLSIPLYRCSIRDGRLREGDQLLAIDGQPLDISHQQAIHILQSAQGPVEIVVARGPVPPASGEAVSAVNVPDNTGVTYEEQQPPLADQPTDSTVEDGGQSPGDKTDMVVRSSHLCFL